jgi:hypothetical protein
MTATTSLKAKVLDAHFSALTDETKCSYSVYQFENGLIMVPSDSTADWFFSSAGSIEGCGNDQLDRVEDTGNFVEFTPSELSRAWGDSVSTFEIDVEREKEVLDLVKSLCRGAGKRA